MLVDLRHSVYKRKGRSGWTLEYREADGTLKQPSFDRRTDAEQAWDDIKDERRRLSGLKTAIPTFRDYARKWLDGLRTDLRPGSVLKYQWALQHLDDLAAHPLDTIDREAVRTLLSKKAAVLSRSSTASIGSFLHACLEDAVADGYLRANPSDGGGSRRRKRHGGLKEVKAVKALEAPQLRAFLTAASGGWRDFFHVMWALGLRPGEAMALQRGDVDFARRRVRVERTCRAEGGRRQEIEGSDEVVLLPRTGPTKAEDGEGYVDLAPGAADILRRYVAAATGDPPWLFPGRNGTMGHATVEHAFKRIAARAGLPAHLTPHSLRHTFAAMHLQRGASIYYVQRMLRHASIQITVDTYGRWLDPGKPELTAAMEADALDPLKHVSPVSVTGRSEAVSSGDPCLLSL